MYKCIAAGSIKGFLIICYPKTKKNQVCQNFYFFKTILKKNEIIEGSRELLLSSSDLKYCRSTVSFPRKA